MVNTSQGQLLKRRREEEGVTLEEEEVKEDVGDHEDEEEEEEETEMSEDFKRFIDEKAKSTINSLFGNLLDIIDGKAVDNSSPSPRDDSSKFENDKIEDIEEAFESLQKSIREMKIPESVTSSMRREFKESKETPKSIKSSGARKKLNRENFKVPSEKPSPAKSVLTPITSDKSSGSGKSSEKGKMMTNYSCPFAPSCDFILTKAEMREMTKASQHLIKEHKVLIFV